MTKASQQYSLIILACGASLACAAPTMAAMVELQADLKASNEVPPNESTGTGSVTASFDTAFETLVRERAGALLVGTGALLTNRRKQIIALAERYAMPAIYPYREFTMDGGLFSYGNNVPDSFRQAGVYAGRILKGDKPADLPVVMGTNFEFVLNRKTAKAIGFTISPLMFTRADEVIE